ncbi:hypothetical protein EYF80_032066 [Liparis tanakae]|uniref:Uncharacterized protein n=1 Tax=Liparis tanakae TaxID=230148 RepID=A0A4Z2GVU7_9TELE|nr:hypothetical protein EYF80_032066 [Liparis tanakae]
MRLLSEDVLHVFALSPRTLSVFGVGWTDPIAPDQQQEEKGKGQSPITHTSSTNGHTSIIIAHTPSTTAHSSSTSSHSSSTIAHSSSTIAHSSSTIANSSRPSAHTSSTSARPPNASTCANTIHSFSTHSSHDSHASDTDTPSTSSYTSNPRSQSMNTTNVCPSCPSSSLVIRTTSTRSSTHSSSPTALSHAPTHPRSNPHPSNNSTTTSHRLVTHSTPHASSSSSSSTEAHPTTNGAHATADCIHLLMDPFEEFDFSFHLLQLLLQGDARGGGFVNILRSTHPGYHLPQLLLIQEAQTRWTLEAVLVGLDLRFQKLILLLEGANLCAGAEEFLVLGCSHIQIHRNFSTRPNTDHGARTHPGRLPVDQGDI